MDEKRGKNEFSLGKYLLKGLIVLIVIGAGYYFYIGRINSSVDDLKGGKEQFRPETPPAVGWVNGILYSEDNPSVVLDKDIVYEGQTVHDVKVVKVHKDKVEFEKDGNRWEQKLKEEPNIYWVLEPENENK